MQGWSTAARNGGDVSAKTAHGGTQTARKTLQHLRLTYVYDEGKPTMAGFLTVLIVVACISAGTVALVGAMHVASNWWVRSGARDVVRGAEALLRAAAAHPA